MVRDRILLIDEDPNLLTCLKTLLEERNLEVETAQGRSQALSYLSRKSIAVLITEYLLEHNDTRDIIRQVKTTSPETYIIVVTAAVIGDILHEELVDLGVDDLFVKPSPIEDIVIAVKRALRTRQRMVTCPLPSALDGLVSSGTTWVWDKLSSAASSTVTMRSPSGIA